MSGLTSSEQAEYAGLQAHVEAGRRVPLVMAAPRRGKPPLHWVDWSPQERAEKLIEWGMPAFRRDQIDRQVFTRHNLDTSTWTDISVAHRQQLAEAAVPPLLERVRDQVADQGTTVKTLWRLFDGSLVESVLMRYGVPGIRSSGRGKQRATICISSQAGCGMACPFCATGQGGLKRNLSAAEIVLQVLDAAARLEAGELAGGPGRLSNIVFMGMGEPLANSRSVLQAIRTFTAPAPAGLGLSARGVTVSTVGLVPRIDALASHGIPVTLAVSLHAPDDARRDELCPINTRWPVEEVVSAARNFFEKTGRRVSIEYALIRDVNDQAWRADALAELLDRGGHGWVHVNLIPLNPTPGSRWTSSRRADEAEFIRRLRAGGVTVTLRDTRGREIDGACGQLAALIENESA